MSKIVLFCVSLLVIMSNTTYSTNFPLDSSTGQVTYTAVVTVDSTLTADILYTNAKEWAAKYFKSAQHVIQMDDKETGTLILKGNFKTGTNCRAVIGPTDYINFTLSIYTKNGRYKYILTDLIVNTTLQSGDLRNYPIDGTDKKPKSVMPKKWRDTLGIAHTMSEDLVNSLKSGIIAKRNDNW